MKRRLRVCTSCSSHVPVTTPLNAPCPFCGFIADAQGAQELSALRDTVLAKGKSGVMIAALGLSMACGEAEPKPENNDTNTTPNSTTNIENPNITADYAGGPINIEPNFETGPNLEPGPDAGSDAGADGGTTDMG